MIKILNVHKNRWPPKSSAFAMFLLFFVVSGADVVTDLRAMINEKRYRACYELASAQLAKSGTLDADPKIFFMKGQCAYEIAKFDESINDLSRFITSGSAGDREKKTAFLVRGQARLRLGLFEDSESDARQAGDKHLLDRVAYARNYFETAKKHEKEKEYAKAVASYERALKTAVSAVKIMIAAAKCALLNNDVDKFGELTYNAVQVAPRDPELLEVRGRFFLCDGDLELAIRHFKVCMSVASDSSTCTVLFRASNGFDEQYRSALNMTRKKKFEEAAKAADQCGSTAARRCSDNSRLVHMAKALKAKVMAGSGKVSEALRYINAEIAQYPNSTELLLGRGDIYVDDGDLDMAMKDYQTARNIDPDDKRANDGVEKVSRLQDAETNVDFYEVLEISRGASVSEVKMAYNRLVRQWHPDRYSDKRKKREAEKRMKNINRAYDVLGNEDKKRRYDAGRDPDAEESDGFPGGPMFRHFHGNNFHFNFY